MIDFTGNIHCRSSQYLRPNVAAYKLQERMRVLSHEVKHILGKGRPKCPIAASCSLSSSFGSFSRSLHYYRALCTNKTDGQRARNLYKNTMCTLRSLLGSRDLSQWVATVPFVGQVSHQGRVTHTMQSTELILCCCIPI